jgi:tetratricopeptide (TPR) repeat protein
LTICRNRNRDDSCPKFYRQGGFFCPPENGAASTSNKTELTAMTFSRSRIAMTAILALFVAAGGGCTLVNKIRAKNELNETAQSYRDGHIEEAEAHAKKALYYDPDNRTALIFIARVVHQQYKQGVETPDNIAKAKEAIAAYQRVLEKDPTNEEAYKAVSVLYASIKDDTSFRQWIMRRATDSTQPNEKRAEAYAILAGKDWDCSFKVTELPEVKQTSNEGGSPKVTYKKPKEQKDFDKIQRCVAQGLEEAETAIKFDSNNESAWSYKTDLLLESAKIADMNGDAARKASFEKQAQIAGQRAAALVEERRKKEEAAQAAASPTPGG